MKPLSIPLLFLMALPLRAEDTALTIYNGGFGVVRDTVPLVLKAGDNRVEYNDATMHIEPDSVILRDPSGSVTFSILEQNYRNDPVTQQLLLSRFEGQKLKFRAPTQDDPERIIEGTVIRSGYVPHDMQAMRNYGNQYYQRQMAAMNASREPIIEVNGELQFSLPGQPMFPALANDSILKPTLSWTISSAAAAKLDAELAYITAGMGWEADYNLVGNEEDEKLDIVGWVTIDNQTGKLFEDAQVKLMAGDVNKIEEGSVGMLAESRSFAMDSAKAGAPQVTEKTFDEYHLYTLQRPLTIRDRETKQVEFLRAGSVPSKKLYVYDGAFLGSPQYRGWNTQMRRTNPDYGTESNPKVWVMREFENSEENNLGMPLPMGRLRFYQQDTDGQLEFLGESEIDHTPKDETVRVYTGNAFDIVGERVRTDFKVDNSRDMADEAFRITLRNHKEEPVEVRVVEYLYRWTNWEITEHSDPFEKIDSQQIEFRVEVPSDGEKTITYKVHYTW